MAKELISKIVTEITKNIDVTIRLVIMSNPKIKGSTEKSAHNYSIMFREKEGKIPFIEDLREIEPMVQALSERFDSVDVSIKKVRYDGEIFNCIYVDVVKNGEKIKGKNDGT